MPSTPEIRALITNLFDEWRRSLLASDWQVGTELRELEISLLREEVEEVPRRLETRHKIDLRALLEILREHRMRWRFAYPERLFQGRTEKQITRLPTQLTESADALDAAVGMLDALWTTRLTERYA